MRNAASRPGTNWPGTAPAAYTDTMAATPTALPSCCVVCSRPDAEPACSGSTPPSTVAVIGMKMNPVARPAIVIGPNTAPK